MGACDVSLAGSLVAGASSGGRRRRSPVPLRRDARAAAAAPGGPCSRLLPAFRPSARPRCSSTRCCGSPRSASRGMVSNGPNRCSSRAEFAFPPPPPPTTPSRTEAAAGRGIPAPEGLRIRLEASRQGHFRAPRGTFNRRLDLWDRAAGQAGGGKLTLKWLPSRLECLSPRPFGGEARACVRLGVCSSPRLCEAGHPSSPMGPLWRGALGSRVLGAAGGSDSPWRNPVERRGDTRRLLTAWSQKKNAFFLPDSCRSVNIRSRRVKKGPDPHPAPPPRRWPLLNTSKSIFPTFFGAGGRW